MSCSVSIIRRPFPLRSWAAVLWTFLTCLVGDGVAGEETTLFVFKTSTDSRVSISGRANIGRWECDTSDIRATIAPGPRVVAFALGQTLNNAGDTAAPAPPDARIVIPVESLRCDKPGMRADLLRALHHERAPEIIFQLTAVEALEHAESSGSWPAYRVTARGDLQLAGETRPLLITADVQQESATRFRVLATQTLRMSDFSITPPTAFFGLIRAENIVEITFDLRFELASTGTR